MQTTTTLTCKTCKQPVSDNYCSNCGEHVVAPRISFKNFLSDILSDTIALEAPVFYTIKQLILNPGKVALRYVSGNRKVFTKPFAFFLLMIGVNYVLNQLLIDPEELLQHINENFLKNLAMIPKQSQAEFTQSIEWANKFQDYMKEMNFMLIPFLSISSWIFFRKSKHNLLENMVLFFYTMGIIMTFAIVTVLLSGISLNTMSFTSPIMNIVKIVYIIWAQVQFHQQANFKGILKALAVYILSIAMMGAIASLFIFFFQGWF